jgi:hypothetical protein
MNEFLALLMYLRALLRRLALAAENLGPASTVGDVSLLGGQTHRDRRFWIPDDIFETHR